jgi:hypothetical protein
MHSCPVEFARFPAVDDDGGPVVSDDVTDAVELNCTDTSRGTPRRNTRLISPDIRFVGRIDGDASAYAGSVAADAASDPPFTPAATGGVNRRALWRTAAAILLAAGAVAVWIAQRHADAETAPAGAQLAVMPFRALRVELSPPERARLHVRYSEGTCRRRPRCS